MRSLTVATLFACALFCANAQSVAVEQSIGDKIPLPKEGGQKPDTDEPATEDYKDGDDEVNYCNV
jgi:hypothetical protein